jgi:glycosyltransferase involved in cell wall biosynthesis
MTRAPRADTGTAASGLPTVSVLLPNHNHARFIDNALRALAAQTQPADEILVIEDASTDDSLAVIESFAETLPQLRILRNLRNLGVNESINRGLAKAQGTHVVCTGADDWLEPDFIACMAAAAALYPQARLYVSDYVQHYEPEGRRVHHRADSELGPWYADGTTQYFGPDEFRLLLTREFVWLPLNAALVERAALLAIDGYDPRLRWHADWFATYTLALRHGFVVVPEPLSVFRVEAGTYSGTGMRNPRQQRQVCAAIYDKLSEPEFADIRDALREHPVAFSTFLRPLAQILALRPRDWPYLGSLARWWLKEVVHGRRPGILRKLTTPLRAPPYSKKIQP